MALVGRNAVVQEPSTHRTLVFNLNDAAMLIGERLNQGLAGSVAHVAQTNLRTEIHSMLLWHFSVFPLQHGPQFALR